jgi:hypothetical protein
MVYGVADAGIADVFTVAENAPFAPIVAGVATLLIVIDTVSPLGGNDAPAASVPESVTEAVPKLRDCEAGTVNVSVALLTVNVVLLFVALLKLASPA